MSKRLPRPAVLQRFGRLRVIIPEGRRTNTKGRRDSGRAALCLCDCGKLHAVTWHSLYSSNTTSCGCYAREQTTSRNTTHDLYDTTEYNSWITMKRRCSNPSAHAWHRYGGRGIKVCPEWERSFEAFLKDVGPKPSPQHSIERIDGNGNYEPSNCIWATHKQQMRNTSRNVYLLVDGVRMCQAEACETLGVNRGTVMKRKRRGLPPERWFEPSDAVVSLTA